MQFSLFCLLKEWPKNGRGWCHCFPNELNAEIFFLSSLAPRAIDKHKLRHIQQHIEISNIPTVHHLYKYCCLLEMFKIIKLMIPIALYSLFTRSNRRENYFITNRPSTSFIYQSSHMWNNCY